MFRSCGSASGLPLVGLRAGGNVITPYVLSATTGLIYVSERKGFSLYFISLLFQEKYKDRFILPLRRSFLEFVCLKLIVSRRVKQISFLQKVGES